MTTYLKEIGERERSIPKQKERSCENEVRERPVWNLGVYGRLKSDKTVLREHRTKIPRMKPHWYLKLAVVKDFELID